MGIDPLSLIMFAFSTAYQISQQNKMKTEADKRKGFNLTVSGTADSLPVAYGKNLLGGIEVKHLVSNGYTAATNNSQKIFQEDFANTSRGGSKPEYLNVQYAICHDGIEGVQWVKVNDQDYNTNSEKFKHIIRTHRDGGTADAISTANGIPSTNKFTDTAFAAATFRLDRDDYNYNGMPSMGFLVKGRKVRWISKSGSNYTLNGNYVYSNNPALCLLDYLTNDKFGRGLPTTGIDLESFYNAAKICDTIVATTRTVSGQVNGQKSVNTVADLGSRPTNLEEHTYENQLWYTTASAQYWYWDKTEWVLTTLNSTRPIPLYECNITLDTSDTIRDNIERIMNTMGLAELTWSSEGKYKLLLEYPETLSELEALVDPDHDFTENDIIRDSGDISWPSATDRLNQVTVSFLNEHEDFKEDTVTWPPAFSSVHNIYLDEDNDQPFRADVQADGVTDPYHALAMAEQMVRNSRSIFTVNLTVSKKGLNIEPGDFIKITSELMSISNEVFRVQNIEVRTDLTVNLTCYKFDHEALAWNVDDNVAYATPPVFDFSVEAPTDAVFTYDSSDNLGTSAGKLSWVAADDIAALEYLVEISHNSGASYQTLGVTRTTSIDISGLKSGVYSFSIRSRTPLGTLSSRLELNNKTIQLKTVGKVAVIYANTVDETTNTQSYTLGSNEFVAYYDYTGDTPTLPIRSNITFAKFVGADGTDGADGVDGADGDDGSNGDDGVRGPGWWRYETGNSSAVDSLSTSTLNSYFATATGLSPVAADRFIIANTIGEATGYLRNNSNTAWIEQAEFIDGHLLVNGTVTADAIAAETITGGLLAATDIITDSAQIKDAMVTTAKIADANITAAKIANANITAAKIADANITTAKIQDLSVSTLKIANQAVSNTAFASGSVTNPTFNAWSNVASLSFSTEGSNQMILQVSGSASGFSEVSDIKGYYRILVAGSVVYTSQEFNIGDGGGGRIFPLTPAMRLSASTSGATGVVVQVIKTSGTSPSIGSFSATFQLLATELKK
jgi:hypothetical protein